MSDNTIHVHLKIGVPSENTADFMALMDELVERARQEQGTLVYEWYMEDDGVTWHTVERYADGAQRRFARQGICRPLRRPFFRTGRWVRGNRFRQRDALYPGRSGSGEARLSAPAGRFRPLLNSARFVRG